MIAEAAVVTLSFFALVARVSLFTLILLDG